MATFSELGPNAIALIEAILAHPSIQACWPMNEASGSILDRCARSRLTGTVSGSPAYGVDLGKGFKGLTFAAGSQAISFGDASALRFLWNTPFTFLFVVKPAFVGGFEYWLSKFDDGGVGWYVAVESGTGIDLYLQAAGPLRVRTNAIPANGTLTIFGITYDGSGAAAGVTFYKDGAVYADTDINDLLAGGSIANSVAVRLSRASASGVTCSQGILAIFNAVLTAREMRNFAHLGGFL